MRSDDTDIPVGFYDPTSGEPFVPPSCDECNYSLEETKHDGMVELRLAHDPWCPAWRRKQESMGMGRSDLAITIDKLAKLAVKKKALIFYARLNVWFVPDVETQRFDSFPMTKVYQAKGRTCWAVDGRLLSPVPGSHEPT